MFNSVMALLARAQDVPSEPLESPYGYTPSLSSTVAFTVVFSLLTLVHLGLAVRYKYWSAIITMVIGGLLEIIGWAGRLWSAKNVLMWDPFIMQTCCLILGPVFFSAWDYTMLGLCIRRLGPQYSLLGPKWYLIVFVVCDLISLVLQAVGGGGAAVNAQNYEDTSSNTHIMLAGIVFQLGITVIFAVLAGDFMLRVMSNRPYPAAVKRAFSRKRTVQDTASETTTRDLEAPHDKEAAALAPASENLRGAQLLLLGVGFATLMIVIRGIYRTIELAQGWTGHLITHEVYFIWLDGFIMVLCMAALAVAHPGFLLPSAGWK